MITTVTVAGRAAKDLRKCPVQVQKKFRVWTSTVQLIGLEETRKQSGYHDEPLAGDRAGQRSIRLSRLFRAFYVVRDGAVQFVEVIEINAHNY